MNPTDAVNTAGASLSLVGLERSYGNTGVVRNVSIEVAAGEFLTILGPSGSGKTTTLNMVAGFTSVDSGTISMDGVAIESLPPHRRNIGMVFQHYALFPHMTVEQNVAFPLRQRKVDKTETGRRVAEALERVHLTGYGTRMPRQLSGGQQQRVALARALVFGPRLMLMDEPLGALDKKLREALQLEIRRLHRELGITFIYVTHDQEEALVLSDRIAIMNEGRIEQLGSAEDLYESPATRFVADFVGESNIFSGRLTSITDGIGSVTDGDRVYAARLNPVLGVGDSVGVVVRPERMRIMGDATSGHLTGTVTQVIYLGSGRRLEITLDGGAVVTSREQAGALSSAHDGDRVSVGWEPHDAVLVPGSTTSVRSGIGSHESEA